MVPSEWVAIYGALYEESRSFEIDKRERHQIEKDVHRTFGLFTRYPSFKIKLRMTDYYESLNTVLLAACHERGYCQGINFIAAVFLLSEESDKDAYIVLCYLLKHCHLVNNKPCHTILYYELEGE